jgi:hypothetical protein
MNFEEINTGVPYMRQFAFAIGLIIKLALAKYASGFIRSIARNVCSPMPTVLKPATSLHGI